MKQDNVNVGAVNVKDSLVELKLPNGFIDDFTCPAELHGTRHGQRCQLSLNSLRDQRTHRDGGQLKACLRSLAGCPVAGLPVSLAFFKWDGDHHPR